ncbi:hypothetical protein NG726_28470, partial [Pseudomonas sp. MOB-449]|nr:hypothetical protein [Pseudomonas sp. MOB-449]
MNHTATRAAVNTSEQRTFNPETEDAAGRSPCTSTTTPIQALDLQGFSISLPLEVGRIIEASATTSTTFLQNHYTAHQEWRRQAVSTI